MWRGLARTQATWALHSIHARNYALGLGTLSEMIHNAPAMGQVIFGVNGDFYQRDKAFAGDPVDCKLSMETDRAPIGGISFWWDGAAHLTQNCDFGIQSHLARRESHTHKLSNEDRRTNTVALYTPRWGGPPHKRDGLE